MAATEAASWGLIGYGTIGQELGQQVMERPGFADRMGLSTLPNFVLRSSGMYNVDPENLNLHPAHEEWDDLVNAEDLPDVVFVALPSTNDGKTAGSYIGDVLKSKASVVTAEKGALANNFRQLRMASDNFDRLGYNATVGGGTRTIKQLREYTHDSENVNELHLVLNGTLTYIFGAIAPPSGTGVSLGEAGVEAQKLGYAEPGSKSVHDVIRGEAEGDIPKKISILFNSLGLSESILPWQALTFKLRDEDIKQAVSESTIRRFITSIYPSDAEPTSNDIIGKNEHIHDGWRIVTGFAHIERNPLYGHLGALTGPNNGFTIGLGPDNTSGAFRLSGPGAGSKPTVDAMLSGDWLDMRSRQKTP